MPPFHSVAPPFQQQLRDIDARPDTMFVQHDRPEYQFPMHQHQKGQFLYVEDGVAFLITPTESYFLPARHYVWVPPGMAHHPLLRSARSRLHSLCFPAEADQEHSFFSAMGIYPLTPLLAEMLRHTEGWQGAIGPEEADKYLFLRCLRSVLPAASPHALPMVLPTTDDPRLHPVLAYVHQHLAEPLTLAGLARQFGFSLRSLARLFQQRISLSFVQYLKRSRVIAAMELLLQTTFTISEIAEQVGYASLSAFSNTFYQLVQRRPTEFAAQAPRWRG